MLAIALATLCHPPGDETQAPAPSTWTALDRDIAALAAAQSSSSVTFGGYLKLAYLWSNTIDIYDPSEVGGFSLAAARLWVEGDVGDWLVHVGLRGEDYPGLGTFGVAGEAGPLTTLEVYAARELVRDHLEVSVGNFRPPLISSALYEENRLLFVERTVNGELWTRYDLGVRFDGEYGPFRAWFAAQNGADDEGQDGALTFRGLWDVLGQPACRDNEGALNAPDGAALTIGGAFYVDTLDDNFSTQALEANFTLERFALQAEAVDNGEGLGDLYSWAATASFLAREDLELAGRYEDFDRDDGLRLYRLGLVKYFRGHDVKASASYTTSDSNAPLADVDVFTLGFVVSF